MNPTAIDIVLSSGDHARVILEITAGDLLIASFLFILTSLQMFSIVLGLLNYRNEK